MSRTDSHVAAQVAVESIVDCGGDGYALDTMMAVLRNAEREGVAALYVDMLRDLVNQGAFQ